MSDSTDGEARLSRRRLLAAAGASIGSIGLFADPGRGQTTTTEPEGEAQIQQRAVIPRVGQPFEGEYVGQFVIFTDPTPRDDVTPAIVGECDFANWAPEDTRGYQGLLLDRLTDDPVSTEIPMYTNGNKERVPVGTSFIVGRTESCSDDFLGLEVESVPVQQFEPDYDTQDNPLIGEESGPTVSPVEGGETEAPGQPGLGVGAALGGIGAALLRRLAGSARE